MASGHHLTSICFIPASTTDRATGLLYFVEATYGVLRISFTVRATRDGRRVLSFPVRHDRNGRQRSILRPLDDTARLGIEAQVFTELGIKVEGAAT